MLNATAKRATMQRRNQGFTMIELSISLVIIGLVVGGVLVGQTMIESANIRKAVSDLRKISTAVNAFKVKYNCVPGDCAHAMNYFSDVSNLNLGWCSGNGDGNGLIDSWPCEGVQAKQTLFFSGLMRDNISPSVSWVYFNGPDNSQGYYFSDDLYGLVPARKKNTISYFTFSGGCVNGHMASPNKTMNIDQKMDDGLPNTGILLASDGATSTSACAVTAASCVTAGVNSYVQSDSLGCRMIYYLE